jgi:hypothetical protein
MSFFQTKTKALLVFAIAALGLNLYSPNQFQTDVSELVMIPPLAKEQMTRIEITQSGEKVVLEQSPGGWVVQSPYTSKADQARVMSMILNFRKGIPMDVLIDSQNYDTYGLDSSNGIVVEIWESGSESPAVSFTLGSDTGVGSTFVRLSDDENVYRARIGSRHRYSYLPSEWKNQVLLDFGESAVRSYKLVSQEGDSFQLTASGEDWLMQPQQSWSLDTEAIDGMLRSLGRLRVGLYSDQVVQEPQYRIQFELKDDRQLELLVGSMNEQTALVQIVGDDNAVRVPARAIRMGTMPLGTYRNKSIFTYVARSHFDTLSFEQGQITVLLQQDLSTGFWTVNQPTNMDVELKSIFFMVNTLAALEAKKVEDNPPLDQEVLGHITLRMLDRTTDGLTVYSTEYDDLVLVKKDSTTLYFWVERSDVEKLFQGFGQVLPNKN